jgi:hypothetical protein
VGASVLRARGATSSVTSSGSATNANDPATAATPIVTDSSTTRERIRET